MKTPLEKFTQPITTAVIILVALFLFGKFGPGLPLSVNQITTNKDMPFMVTGDGKVTAKPDTAEVNFGLETSGTTVIQTQNKSNTILNNIVAKIKTLGIAESDIKTTNYNIYPQYSDQFAATPLSMPAPQGVMEKMIAPSDIPPNPTQPKIIGYKVNINVTVTVHDLSKVNQVVDTATANGANQIGGVNFIVDKPEQFQSQARKLAIADAKKKAQDLAGEAGITLGKIVSVAENPGYFPRPYAIMATKMEADGSANPQTQLNPGSTEISTQVTLSFETR